MCPAAPTPRCGLNGFVIARESRKEVEETPREIVAKAHRPIAEGLRRSCARRRRTSPEPVAPDLVDVFRKDADPPGAAREAVDAGAKSLWLQLGSWNEEVAVIAAAGGLDVVMDRCVKSEHARFHGGLHLAGFNTGEISSRTQRLSGRG